MFSDINIIKSWVKGARLMDGWFYGWSKPIIQPTQLLAGVWQHLGNLSII